MLFVLLVVLMFLILGVLDVGAGGAIVGTVDVGSVVVRDVFAGGIGGIVVLVLLMFLCW